MRLLIADDSELLLERLITLLSDIKNLDIVGTAENSLKAFNMVKELKPDFVITDIRLPGGGGIELLENIKSNQPWTKVIVYTNYPYPQYEQKCLQSGAEYFFHKGTESEELYDTVKKLCVKKEIEVI